MDDEADSVPADASAEAIPISFAEFLERTPPSTFKAVSDVRKLVPRSNSTTYGEIRTPDLQLHCPSNVCNGLRFFRYEEGESAPRRRVSPMEEEYHPDSCRLIWKLTSGLVG